MISLSIISIPAHASTNVILNDTIGANAGDSEVYQGGSGLSNWGAFDNINIATYSSRNRRVFYRYDMNITKYGAPAGAKVTNAIFCSYMYTAPSSSRYYAAYNTSPMNTTGASYWNEGTLSNVNCSGGVDCNLDHNITWVNQPSAGTLQDIVSTGTAAKWMCWNVTDSAVTSNENATYPMLSLMIRDSQEDNVASIISYFYTKEYTNASMRSYVNVTYHDVSLPQWSLNSTNSTVIGGQPVRHSTYWTDLDGMSKFIFSTNITGSWVNDTASSLSGGWANVTKTAPLLGVVGWQVFANDTSGNWNSTPVFTYDVYALNLTPVYPFEVNETGNYSVLAFYAYNGSKIQNATLTICYTFTSMTCDSMTEDADYYYWNFSYDHDVGGIVQFNITARYNAYPNVSTVFYITFFDARFGVRFWQDLNKTQPYFNEFLWVYAKPHCDLFDQLLYFGLYDTCSRTAYHAPYAGGVANLSIWSPNTYDLYIVDGNVFWNCTTCEPSAVGYSVWDKFDTITITAAGNSVRDYFWNTTVYGEYPLFGNIEWDFWLSVAGIIILIAVSCLVAIYSDNGLASVFIIILCYILLKLFHILTGSVLFIF
jgi:hypothetical protein